MNNKRGQNLTLGTILLIILGLAVLVMLVYGFSVGWGNLFDRITQFTGGSSNIDSVNQACEIACSTQDQYTFCDLTRNVRAEDGFKASTTCDLLTRDVEFAKGSESKTISRLVEYCPGLCD